VPDNEEDQDPLAPWESDAIGRIRDLLYNAEFDRADLAEGLAELAFGIKLAGGSTNSYDGTCSAGKRWQVKGRRLTAENPSTGLSVIRNLGEARFHYLLAIYFEEDFSVRAAYRVDHAAVQEHAGYSKQQGGHVLRLKQALLADARCIEVTGDVRWAAAGWTG
jgi:hypothetical protein